MTSWDDHNDIIGIITWSGGQSVYYDDAVLHVVIAMMLISP